VFLFFALLLLLLLRFSMEFAVGGNRGQPYLARNGHTLEQRGCDFSLGTLARLSLRLWKGGVWEVGICAFEVGAEDQRNKDDTQTW